METISKISFSTFFVILFSSSWLLIQVQVHATPLDSNKKDNNNDRNPFPDEAFTFTRKSQSQGSGAIEGFGTFLNGFLTGFTAALQGGIAGASQLFNAFGSAANTTFNGLLTGFNSTFQGLTQGTSTLVGNNTIASAGPPHHHIKPKGV